MQRRSHMELEEEEEEEDVKKEAFCLCHFEVGISANINCQITQPQLITSTRQKERNRS